MIQHLPQILGGTVYAVLVFAFLYATKLIHDRTTSFNDDHEVEEKSNLAVGLRRAGLYLGSAIALLGPLYGQDKGFWTDLRLVLVEGVAVLAYFFIAAKVMDKLVLHRVNNDAEVQKGNIAVGIAEGGEFIATGLIAYGSFAGEGGSIITATVFFLLGQTLLVVFSRLWMAKFDVIFMVERGNSAAGVLFAGKVVALGIILRAALNGAFTSYIVDITSFLIWAVVGAVLLAIAEWASDHLFLPHTDIATEVGRDSNVAAVALSSVLLIAIALVMSSAVL